MAFDALLRLFVFRQKSMKKIESSDFSTGAGSGGF